MTHAKGARIRVRGLQPAQVLAGLAGIAFLIVGIIGFSRTGVGNFAGHHDAGLWRFSGNPLTSLVRVITGVIGLLLAFGSGRARTFGWLLFLGYGALFVWGLMIDGLISSNPFANAGNPMDLTRADTWLHLGVAALGLLIAVLPARRTILIPEEEVTDDTLVTDDRLASDRLASDHVDGRVAASDRAVAPDHVVASDRLADRPLADDGLATTDRRVAADRAATTDRMGPVDAAGTGRTVAMETEEPRRGSFLRRATGRGPDATREERPPGLAH